jgi:hypothetical protein
MFHSKPVHQSNEVSFGSDTQVMANEPAIDGDLMRKMMIRSRDVI